MSIHSDLSNYDSLVTMDLKSEKKNSDSLINFPDSNSCQTNYFSLNETISSSSSSSVPMLRKRGRPPKIQSSQSFEKIDNFGMKMYESIRSDFFEKLRIIKNQPKVQMGHATPVQVLVIDQNTNKVCTNALLFISNYKSYSSKCVWCPLCKIVMDVSQFLKHLEMHFDISEDQNCMKKSKKIYNMYLCDSEKGNDYSTKKWKTFKRNFLKFKEEHENSRKIFKKLINEDEISKTQSNIGKNCRESHFLFQDSSVKNLNNQNIKEKQDLRFFR